MIKSGDPLADQLMDKVKGLLGKWAMLKEEGAKRRVTLESAMDAYLFSDCNETDSVIKELITLAKSKVKPSTGLKELFQSFCYFARILVRTS